MPNQNKKVVEFEKKNTTNKKQTGNKRSATKTRENETTTETAEVTTPISKEVIDLEWEEIQNIFHARDQLAQMENALGAMFIQFEKNRHDLTSRIHYVEGMVYKLAEDLKTSKNVDESLTYELKLPNNENEKGYFLLREE